MIEARRYNDLTLSKHIAVMNFIAALLIVILHSGYSGTGCLSCILGSRGLCRIAVPWFFIISGYFLAKHVDEKNWYKDSLCKRVKSVLVPFYIWMVLYKLFNYLLYTIMTRLAVETNFANPFAGKDFVRIIFEFTGLMPCAGVGVVWYLRMLFFLVLLSPLLIQVVIKLRLFWLITVFCIYLSYRLGLALGYLEYDGPLDYYFSLRGLAYFSVGIYFRLVDNVLRRTPLAVAGGIGIVLLVIKVLVAQPMVSAFCDVFMVPGLIAFIWIISRRIRFPMWCVGNTMAIYLWHPIFMLLSIGVVVIFGMRNIMYESPLICMARCAGAVTGSLIATAVIKICSPTLSKVLLGGR